MKISVTRFFRLKRSENFGAYIFIKMYEKICKALELGKIIKISLK